MATRSLPAVREKSKIEDSTCIVNTCDRDSKLGSATSDALRTAGVAALRAVDAVRAPACLGVLAFHALYHWGRLVPYSVLEKVRVCGANAMWGVRQAREENPRSCWRGPRQALGIRSRTLFSEVSQRSCAAFVSIVHA